jgi:NADPH2:quinone reductase
MKAIRVERPGEPEVMQLVELPTRLPAAGEITVRVEAAGVNFVDIYYRSGAYPREPPFFLGEEGAGVVEAIEPGVTGVKVGDRVAWASATGSYATHIVVRADHVVPVPEGVTNEQAAAVMLQGMTADYLARSTFPLGRDHICVVHAAAGGVGLLLVQMAKRAGARAIGTTSTDAKARIASEAGAYHVLIHEKGWSESVRRLTGRSGADVVYDSIGAATFEESLRSLRPRGMLVLYGQSSGPVPPVDLQRLAMSGSLFATRPTLRHYVATRAELVERAERVLQAVGRGELSVRIHGTYPLARAADAHRDLAARATMGKLLLVP